MTAYSDGVDLAELFGRFEYALKRAGFLRRRRPDAQADWTAFADELGSDFLAHVKDAGIAETLLNNPPRRLMADGLTWQPEQPAPILDVVALFVRGVCRVRNSYIHGEKFVGRETEWERDAALVHEALQVLRAAQDRIPNVSKLLTKRQGGELKRGNAEH